MTSYQAQGATDFVADAKSAAAYDCNTAEEVIELDSLSPMTLWRADFIVMKENKCSGRSVKIIRYS